MAYATEARDEYEAGRRATLDRHYEMRDRLAEYERDWHLARAPMVQEITRLAVLIDSITPSPMWVMAAKQAATVPPTA